MNDESEGKEKELSLVQNEMPYNFQEQEERQPGQEGAKTRIDNEPHFTLLLGDRTK